MDRVRPLSTEIGTGRTPTGRPSGTLPDLLGITMPRWCVGSGTGVFSADLLGRPPVQTAGPHRHARRPREDRSCAKSPKGLPCLLVGKRPTRFALWAMTDEVATVPTGDPAGSHLMNPNRASVGATSLVQSTGAPGCDRRGARGADDAFFFWGGTHP